MPYVTELISRDLARDLRTFSLAAICIFGVVLLAICYQVPAWLFGASGCPDATLADITQ